MSDGSGILPEARRQIQRTALNYVVNETDVPYFSEMMYDEVDRSLRVTDPEGNIAETRYTIDTDGSVPLHKTRSLIEQNDTETITTDVFKDANEGLPTPPTYSLVITRQISLHDLSTMRSGSLYHIPMIRISLRPTAMTWPDAKNR